jgi:hypothetical protein
MPGPASPEVARAGTEIAVIFGENRTDSPVEGEGLELWFLILLNINALDQNVRSLL